MNYSKPNRRSNCPISYSLEQLGDSWSLLIIRDIIFAGKKTFGEFLSSDEGIARNILSNRLSRLETGGLISKSPHPDDRRKDLYELTEAGLDLLPVLFELSYWGAKQESKTAGSLGWLEDVQINKDHLIQLIQQTVRKGGSVFTGSDSVVNQLDRKK